MRLIFAEQQNVTTEQQVFQATDNDTIISAVVIGGATGTSNITLSVSGVEYLKNYPIPEKGIALAEIEGQVLASGDTISLSSDNSINIRCTFKVKEY